MNRSSATISANNTRRRAATCRLLLSSGISTSIYPPGAAQADLLTAPTL
ncbi:MAG TPA: hypothetical protein GX715_12680 [Armatimonadetes bacterium]|nr:hypothetical protein [Armatimonadota bacterium]